MYHLATLVIVLAAIGALFVSPLLALILIACSAPFAKRATAVDADAFWGWAMLFAIGAGIFLMLA